MKIRLMASWVITRWTKLGGITHVFCILAKIQSCHFDYNVVPDEVKIEGEMKKYLSKLKRMPDFGQLQQCGQFYYLISIILE